MIAKSLTICNYSYMVGRPFWVEKLKNALRQRRIVWIAGVRRVGKTTLCHQFSPTKYYDCELPSVREQLEDVEYFWKNQKPGVIVLDEIHRLLDPSNVLKIAHDHFPKIKVIATGSSTLSARHKFKDTLTDRKRNIWLQPFLLSEIKPQNKEQLTKRLLHGGLPPSFFADRLDDAFFSEWLDSYWAKDVQELFPIERKTSFMKMTELILRQSGGIFEANSFSGPCGISRQTVSNYLDILNVTLIATSLRPFDRGRSNEIVRAPKVYGFDTGFVCFARGWQSLRPEDYGVLLEHLVFQELLARNEKQSLYYWRDKQKHEVDFLLKPSRGKQVHAIECKSSIRSFDPKSVAIFRKNSPDGKNFLVSPDVFNIEKRKIESLEFTLVPVSSLDVLHT